MPSKPHSPAMVPAPTRVCRAAESHQRSVFMLAMHAIGEVQRAQDGAWPCRVPPVAPHRTAPYRTTPAQVH